MKHRLSVFISSTGDLTEERDAVEAALADLNIDGSRFEFWPSAPNHPMDECLKNLEECDAVVFLIGKRYGSLSNAGISATHLEYRHATKLTIPRFVYLLKTEEREADQIKFIDEIEKSLFRCKEINTPNELRSAVRYSFLNIFARCFKEKYTQSPEKRWSSKTETIIASDFVPPVTLEETHKLLEKLYFSGDNLGIQRLAQASEAIYRESSEIMNIIFMAEVNLAMDGVKADAARLVKAIEFWDCPTVKKRWVNYSLFYNQGNAFIALKQFRKAIEYYRAALAEKPDYAQCWKNLGDAYRDMDDITSAQNCYEKSLKLVPNLFEALLSYATLLIRHKDNPGEALNCLNKISLTSLSPNQSGTLYGWQAAAYLKLGCYAEGIAKAEDAIVMYPDAEWTWNIAGRLYALARRDNAQWIEPSVEFWNRFIDKYPQSCEAWAELGFVYWFLRDKSGKAELTQKALHAFTKAMMLGFEDDGLVWDRIGHLFEATGNLSEAENAYRKAVINNTNNKEFDYCLGVCLMSLGKYKEALPLVLAAAENHQPDALSWIQVAICQINLGNDDEAAIAYKKALNLDQSESMAWFNLGGIYWNKKDREQATIIWKEAMTRFPEHELCNQVKSLLAF